MATNSTDEAGKTNPPKRFRPGDGTPGPGRPKGIPNKLTMAAKEIMAAAFEKVGGVEALTAWGKKNPDDFYKLWGRTFPIESKVTGGLTINKPPREMTDEELLHILEGVDGQGSSGE